MLGLLPGSLLLAALPPQEASLLIIVPFAVGLLVLTALFCYLTRAAVTAGATPKEAIRQPLFPLLMALAILVLVTNTFVPFFSFGEDYRILTDCGLATILICGLLLAVWTSSTSIADEIEGKTAMTLLSKPINRRQFVLGKFVGIMTAVFWLMLPLMIIFLALVYYKVGYDSRESANPEPEVAYKVAIMLKTIPGLILIFFEICLLTAVSVAISTRVPMVVNMVTCFAIFVVGHVPSVMVPADYLGYAALYCAAFSTAAIFLAFILFEDRDLA